MGTTIHAGDMLSGCAECAERSVGIVLDFCHGSADMLNEAICRLAVGYGWEGDFPLVESGWANCATADDSESLHYASEEALAWLSERVTEGYALVVEDNSLYCEKVTA